MKINLFLQNDDMRTDAVNISQLNDLGLYVEDGEADEVLALNVLDYIPLYAIPETLAGWLKKIRRGGEISIGASSYRAITRSIFREEFSLEEVNALLYGTGDLSSSPPKRSLLSLEFVESFLTESGFRVIQKRLEGVHFFLKAVRK